MKFNSTFESYNLRISHEHKVKLRELSLTIPERLRTNWIVISGPPHSGKTSVINKLKEQGEIVVEDIARSIIKDKVAITNSKKLGRQDYFSIQETIRDQMLERAKETNPKQRVYWDYFLPDNLAFLYCNGLPWTKSHLNAATFYSLQKVFIFDPLPYKQDIEEDELRVEDVIMQHRLRVAESQIYRMLGYPIVRIKKNSLTERVSKVAEIVKDIDAENFIDKSFLEQLTDENSEKEFLKNIRST